VYNIGSDILQISFTGECWIEVIDSASANIYREIQEPGDLLRITGTAPFRILLGDAPFVEVTLNGQSIDVNASIRIDKSARLVVGL
jgi:cytoskeleton protein RodZ